MVKTENRLDCISGKKRYGQEETRLGSLRAFGWREGKEFNSAAKHPIL